MTTIARTGSIIGIEFQDGHIVLHAEGMSPRPADNSQLLSLLNNLGVDGVERGGDYPVVEVEPTDPESIVEDVQRRFRLAEESTLDFLNSSTKAATADFKPRSIHLYSSRVFPSELPSRVSRALDHSQGK